MRAKRREVERLSLEVILAKELLLLQREVNLLLLQAVQAFRQVRTLHAVLEDLRVCVALEVAFQCLSFFVGHVVLYVGAATASELSVAS